MIEEMKYEKYHDYQDYIIEKRDNEHKNHEEVNYVKVKEFSRKDKFITRSLLIILMICSYEQYKYESRYSIIQIAIIIILFILTFLRVKKYTKIITHSDHTTEYIECCWNEVEKEYKRKSKQN